MKTDIDQFQVRLATCDKDIRAAQRLRYRVFVEEMGATVDAADHKAKIEQDRFDRFFDHLLLIDKRIDPGKYDNHVVGVYRLMRGEVAHDGAGFYGANEYDLSKLENSNRRVVELGRSCIAKSHRGGIGMHLLWDGLGDYVMTHKIEIMFGVASFHGTDITPLKDALAFLHHNHLAPADMRVRARNSQYVALNQLPSDKIDRKAALRAIPSLIKGYLRLGGFVGEGAFIDRDFNTVDVCLLMDTKRMVAKYRNYYTQDRG